MVKGEPQRSGGSRVRRLDSRQRKARARQEANTRPPIIGGPRLSIRALKTIWKFKKPLLGIVLVYLILNIIFASGISNINSAVNDIKFNLNQTDSENINPFGTALSGFGNLVASAGTSSSSTGSALQGILIIIESLVIIWTLRRLMAGQKVRVKQAYYSSTGPLVQFLLVLIVLFIQLLPITLGISVVGAILSSVFVNGGGGAFFLFAIFGAALIGWSLYMLSSSIFSLYIVTLPDMNPRRALRSAKELVAFRRWAIMRRLIFLPVFILGAMAVIVVPLILYLTLLVTPVFLVLSMLSLLFIHTYLYSLYRELIA